MGELCLCSQLMVCSLSRTIPGCIPHCRKPLGYKHGHSNSTSISKPLSVGAWGLFGDVVQFSHSVMSDSLRPHGLQDARPPCPSPTPRACSNSCPSSLWCHQTITSTVFPFSFCIQSFPESGSFPMSLFFASGGQSIGASALTSLLSMNI